MALHGAVVRLLHHRHLLAAGTTARAFSGWGLRARLGRSRCLGQDLRCRKRAERHGGEQSGFHGWPPFKGCRNCRFPLDRPSHGDKVNGGAVWRVKVSGSSCFHGRQRGRPLVAVLNPLPADPPSIKSHQNDHHRGCVRGASRESAETRPVRRNMLHAEGGDNPCRYHRERQPHAEAYHQHKPKADLLQLDAE